MKIFRSASLSAVAALLQLFSLTADAQMPICNAWKGEEYEKAKQTYPALRDAINTVQQQGTAPWYTDNSDANTLNRIVSTLSSQCGSNTKIPLVVYGIPNKDCEAGYSNGGSNKNFDDYKRFIDRLAATFTTQNMIYIVEPDAVGLTANGGCAVKFEYSKYLKYALEALTRNSNAEIYLDVGFWTLVPTANPAGIAKVVNDIWPANGRVKGIALNTSNYQKTDYMIQLCDSFAKITGKSNIKCVIDTSRNFRGPSAKGEWCNVKNTGIGAPPTMNTGNSRAAYYLWVKPPGESDGECNGQTSGDAMVGPRAGAFFKEHFQMLWNNGFFVANGQGRPVSTKSLDDGGIPDDVITNSTDVLPPVDQQVVPAITPAATGSPVLPVESVITPALTTMPPQFPTPEAIPITPTNPTIGRS